MKVEISELLYKKCYIVPFEQQEGTIVAISQGKLGTELKVIYYLNGEFKQEWFFDFDLELEKSETKKGSVLFGTAS